jgi:hypothetical protein
VYVLELLMKARQDELLRAAAQCRLAADVRRARPSMAVLGTALYYAIGPVIADRKLAGADRLGPTAACLGLAALAYAPVAALTWPLPLALIRRLRELLRAHGPGGRAVGVHRGLPDRQVR